MKELMFLIFLVGMAVAIGLMVTAYRQFKISKEGWKLHREETQDSTEIWLVRGKNTHFVGRSMRHLPNYSDKLLEIEDVASDKMYEWNAADKVSRRLYK